MYTDFVSIGSSYVSIARKAENGDVALAERFWIGGA